MARVFFVYYSLCSTINCSIRYYEKYSGEQTSVLNQRPVDRMGKRGVTVTISKERILKIVDSPLYKAAFAARERAYAPYSNFRVGAAIEASDGTIFNGCNVENCSYGLTSCAERNAIFTAVAAGHHDFIKILILSEAEKPATPCGACRQVIAEFAPTIEVISITVDNKAIIETMSSLLPHAFTPKNLD
jgi:cytidine deaminase